MERKLATSDVARILGMTEGRVRSLVRAGLCTPDRAAGGYQFTFRDLVVLRAAQGLLDRDVPAARVERALSSLARALPEGRPLSGLRVFADGRHVAVREGGASWQPETGQVLLDFELDELESEVDALGTEREPSTGEAATPTPLPQSAARAEFARAVELEDSDRAEARKAYERVLRLDPSLVEAYVNLGRLAHDAGEAPEAVRLYHQALERTPDDALIHYNLALALEDTRGAAAAVAHYEKALELDPDFADAHYNLAGLCEQLGRRADALRHYSAYKKLTE